jgi:hypothetical protein
MVIVARSHARHGNHLQCNRLRFRHELTHIGRTPASILRIKFSEPLVPAQLNQHQEYSLTKMEHSGELALSTFEHGQSIADKLRAVISGGIALLRQIVRSSPAAL